MYNSDMHFKILLGLKIIFICSVGSVCHYDLTVSGWPETHYVDTVDFELTEIYLFLTPQRWD